MPTCGMGHLGTGAPCTPERGAGAGYALHLGGRHPVNSDWRGSSLERKRHLHCVLGCRVCARPEGDSGKWEQRGWGGEGGSAALCSPDSARCAP